MAGSQRRSIVRQLWLQRPDKERAATDVMIFYGWLEEHRPELLRRGHGDAYQHLKSDLMGLIKS
jgi:hypothetical protein